MLQSIYKEQIMIVKDPEEISETSSKAKLKSSCQVVKKDSNYLDDHVNDEEDNNDSPSKSRVMASKSVAIIVPPRFDKKTGEKCGTPQFNQGSGVREKNMVRQDTNFTNFTR